MRSTRTNRHALAALFTTAAVLVPTTGASALTYEIQPGDTLSTIAERHGVRLDRLIDANGLQRNPHLIRAGELLTIPGDPAADTPPGSVTPDPVDDATGTPGAATAEAAESTGPADYTVQPGDTLWEISRRSGTSVASLVSANGLADANFLRVGQVLRFANQPAPLTVDGAAAPAEANAQPDAAADVSAPPTDPSIYVVQPGDTLWEIAVAHGTTVAAIAELNGLTDSSILREGRRLNLPPTVTTVAAPVGLPGPLLADPAKLALQPAFDRWADANGVPRDLLKAVAFYESGWDNSVRSSAGAIGIGQILPATAGFVANQLIGVPLDPTVPEDNIRLTARYLRYLLEQTGDERLAIAAYYQGLTAVRVHGIFRSSEYYVDGVQALRSRFR